MLDCLVRFETDMDAETPSEAALKVEQMLECGRSLGWKFDV
jgi:hypothetical protein